MTDISRNGYYRLGLGALALGGVVMILWVVAQLASQSYLMAAKARAETALGLTQNALAAYLARYEMAPQLLAELDAIRRLAGRPDDLPQRAAINVMLAQKNAALASSDIYIMGMDGETIAASNYEQTNSFIGQNFSYRPYFFEAARGKPNRFFALGTTSGVRGYYFSAPIRDYSGRIAGVIAVKIGVDNVEHSWQSSEYRIFLTDPEGIIFMSSDPSLLYAGLLPLTPDRLSRTRTLRRYSDAGLFALEYSQSQQDEVTLLHLPKAGGAQDYVAVQQTMRDAGWTVHVLTDAAPARFEARIVTALVALLICIAGFGLMIVVQRRARGAERLHHEARAKAELEHRVAARTADLARVNSHLEQEIAERRATEIALRAAQANLVQVGKLAALGQMSATLSHEINQPLAAARNYADSAAILIERGETERAKENLGLILSLIDRMSAIGRHLRNAARKPNERLSPVALAPLLEETKVIVSGRLATAAAVLELDIPPDLPPLLAGATRLQQVLVNLITNAADAVENQADRRITLSARAAQGQIILSLRDRGPGIAPALVERIFDPFFTTKGLGAGLGLGLSITSNIIRDFGGEISVHAADPGTEFRVTLPMAQPLREAAA